jgi:mannan endo-1,4-beta-mannosidase
VIRAAAAAVVLAVAVASCAAADPPGQPAGPAAARPVRYVGFTAPAPAVFRQLEQRTGVRANITGLYVQIGRPFPAAAVRSDLAAGILPVIQLDPPGSVYTITDGSQDAWLRSVARFIAGLHRQVAIGFGHEFSNPFWPWSYNHETPAAFTQAWRRVVRIFRGQGARRVAWVWTLSNLTGPRAAPLAPYWPGAGFVTWIGVDAYFGAPGDTFASITAGVLGQVRQFTHDPVLLTETGANPASGRVRAIGSLFRGVRAMPGCLGFVWFDFDKFPAHDWRIDNDPVALSAFRTLAHAGR